MTPEQERQRFVAVEDAFTDLLMALGLNLRDPHLRETPHRAAQAWIEELCAGITRPPPRITTFPAEDSDGMIMLRDIPVKSMCSHHLLPFTGTAVVAYVPGEGCEILGLSKLARIVDYWSRRPQAQERLTKQIADHLWGLIQPDPPADNPGDPYNGGVGVVIRASHTCMSLRGVNHEGDMVTSELRGVFKYQPETRAEFMALAKEA